MVIALKVYKTCCESDATKNDATQWFDSKLFDPDASQSSVKRVLYQRINYPKALDDFLLEIKERNVFVVLEVPKINMANGRCGIGFLTFEVQDSPCAHDI